MDINNVVLSDDLANGTENLESGDADTDGVLDVGEIWIYSATYAADQDDINDLFNELEKACHSYAR